VNALELPAGEMPAIASETDRLVARCKAGEPNALAELYARWDRGVFRLAYWMLSDRDEADDVKQETFVRAFETLARFEGRCSLQSWLYGICGNLCRDRLRKRKSRQETRLDESHIPSGAHNGDPILSLLENEEITQIVAALESLSPEYRRLILLREIEQMSYDEIRRAMGCSMASVKLRLFRARRQWRRRYEDLVGNEVV